MTSSSRNVARRGTLRLDSVSKRFDSGDGHLVLDRVDLRVGPDESLGIIGPNGAGKSTLLKLAAGVTAPSDGTVHRSGRTCSVIELGAAVHPDLTGRENARLLAALYGIPGRTFPRLLDAVVSFAELEHAIDWPTRQYSTGMVARLAFAVAAHSEPDLLLLDEVLSVGDLPFQFRCRERVEELRSSGTTLVMVSHDMDLIAAVCDRVVLLRDADIEIDGPATRVINRYMGLPDPAARDAAPLELRCAHTRVAAGDPLEVTLELHAGDAETRVDLDLVVANHPTLEAHGIEQSVIFGSTRLDVREGRHDLRLDTRHLPPGRYELHASFVAGDRPVTAPPVAVVLTGPRPDLFATQLECVGTLRRFDQGAPA